MCLCPCEFEVTTGLSGLAELHTADVSPSGKAAGVGRLSVTRLTLTDFRCYAFLRLETDGRPVVLTGANGAGKTNLLEALSFLVPGRGLRGARLGESARRDPGAGPFGTNPDMNPGPERPWAVAATVETASGPVEIGTGLLAPAPGSEPNAERRRDKRAVRIDGQPATNQGALSLYLDVQWLTPQMDRLFLEGAGDRRRFIDRLVAGYDPAHTGRVAAYEKAMRERNRLLRYGFRRQGRGPGQGRDLQPGQADGAWLSALEDTMAATGVAITAARRQLAKDLNGIAAHPSGIFPAAELHMAGAVESWLEEGPALAAEDALRRALEQARDGDRESGGAGTGPHRSDLRVRHVARDRAAGQCSTGEQKALLIAIVLANARLKVRHRGAAPLLLLDEVAAHLDKARRAALFSEILDLGAQAWMTGTDEALFEGLHGQAQFFTVENATLTPHS